MKKLKSKKALIIGISVLVVTFILIIGTYVGYNKIYLPSLQDVSVGVYKDNGVQIDQLSFKESSYIQVLDEQEAVTEEIILDEQTNNLTLSTPDNANALLLDDWEIEKKIQDKGFFQRDQQYYTAKPIYKERKDFVLTFVTDTQSSFYEKDQPIHLINVPYSVDDDWRSNLPQPAIEDDFKGYWTVNNEAVTEETTINENTIFEYRTFQDKNDNSIDDFTEEFTVNFVTNTQEVIESRVVGWEGTVELPKLQTLEEENKVFYDWYSDEQSTEVFTNETPVTSDMTLFAQVEYIPDIINTTIDKPIKRKDIAVEVQKELKDRNKKIDDQFNSEMVEEEKEREALKQYNQENNILSDNIEQVTQLHNLGHNKLYLITFLDPLNNFLYAIVAPYGQTLKVVYEDGQLFKEYSIRQDTTIILNQEILLTESNDLDRYDFEYRQINESVFIKAQPVGN